MDRYVKAATILLTCTTLVVKCSSLISCGDPSEWETVVFDPTFVRFEVSRWDAAEKLFKMISCRYEGRSLVLEIRNSMAGASGSANISSDCYAYSNSGQLISSLGAGPIKPAGASIYWMNLNFFIPSIGTVGCNVTDSAGNSRMLTMYDANNMELSNLTIQWSVDERGFSLYNSVSQNFDLYKTW